MDMHACGGGDAANACAAFHHAAGGNVLGGYFKGLALGLAVGAQGGNDCDDYDAADGAMRNAIALPTTSPPQPAFIRY